VPDRNTLWPNLFIPGAQRCGTTFLAAALERDARVSVSGVKEPHFFRRRPLPTGSSMRTINNQADYLASFSDASSMYRCDASTSYLHDPEALSAIQAQCPNPRFIICLRDPVERAWSHYIADSGEGLDKRSFGQAIREEVELSHSSGYKYWTYVEHSRYADALERYLTNAPGRVLVLILEELTDAGRLASVGSFLGLDGFRTDSDGLPRNEYRPARNAAFRYALGSSVIRRASRAVVPDNVRRVVRSGLRVARPRPSMSSQDRHALLSLLQADILRTEELLGRHLPWGHHVRDFYYLANPVPADVQVRPRNPLPPS